MSGLVERVAGAISVAPHSTGDVPPFPEAVEEHRDEAIAAIREVLAALLAEPSEAMVRAYWNIRDSDPLEPEQTETLRRRLGPVLDAFAREHGIEP